MAVKRVLPVFLIILLIPVGYYLTSSGEDENGPPTGIALEIDKSIYSPKDTMILTIVNNAETNATTSYHFKLFRLNNGEWEEVPVNLMFIEVAVIIEPGKSWEQRIKLEDLDLEPGRYRIVKKVLIEGKKGSPTSLELQAEFEVSG